MNLLPESEIYARIGVDGFRRLVAAFYARVPLDPVMGPMYPPEDLAGAEERLRDFLVFRFGGPRDYLEKRGHPRLRMRHAPFAIGPAARDAWLRMMDEAFVEAELPQDVVATMRPVLRHTAQFMMNRDANE